MAHDFCRHLPLSHEEPRDWVDAYDNVTRLSASVGALLRILEASEVESEEDAEVLLELSLKLWEEVQRRLAVLEDLCPQSQDSTPATEKEG